jgi:uncharacterized protein (DUF2267 family)
MRRDDWIREFQRRAGIESRDEAERSAAYVAEELGGCLTWGEAQNLAAWLPEPLATALRKGSFNTAMARFSPRAFSSRVAELDGIGVEEARRRILAFLGILTESLSASRLVHLRQELASWGAELPV